MTANTIYKDYDSRVQEYMQNVIECLEQDYGKIPSSWRVSLDLIADNYSIYLQAKDEIQKDKMFLKDLLKSFALTPMSKSKMKRLEEDDIDADKYLDELIG